MNKKEEFEAQNKSKGSRVDQDSSNSKRTGGPSTQGSGFFPMGSSKTISEFLDYGGRDDVDAKVFHFLYACGIPFNVLCSPYWHEMVEAIHTSPARYKSPRYDKARTVGTSVIRTGPVQQKLVGLTGIEGFSVRSSA